MFSLLILEVIRIRIRFLLGRLVVHGDFGEVSSAGGVPQVWDGFGEGWHIQLGPKKFIRDKFGYNTP